MWRNRHQLMSRLARSNRVIYVEPAVMIRPALRRLFGSANIAESGDAKRTTTHESGVIIYHSPAWIPLIGRRPLLDLSIRLYMRTLFRKCGIEKTCRPIIWLSRPPMSDYLGKVREKLAIYHVVDEYTAYTGVDGELRDWLLDHERSSLEKADAVIVVTATLFDAKVPFNANTYLVPNAVNYDAYANESATVPTDLAAIDSPIIGFTGLVSARLDFELLLECACSRPGWSFVFVGSVDRSECEEMLDKLDALDNVHFLGVKPVESMPGYLQHFDVCTIPYAADDNAANASPLKLYEYAAVKRPIVTTDFPAAREFPGHLHRVTNAAEYIDACEHALSMSRLDTKLLENQQFAASNTWDVRVAQVVDIMNTHLATNDE